MSQRVLAVLEVAYRGAVEQQYAHVLWLLWSLRRMGGTIAVLLRGDATLYARRDQHWPGLTISGLAIPGPEYESSISGLLADGASVYVVDSDMRAHRLEPGGLCTGVQAVGRADLPHLLSSYDTVWYI